MGARAACRSADWRHRLRNHPARMVSPPCEDSGPAHWRTIKPAYRITLADGTSLTAEPTTGFSPNEAGSSSPPPMPATGRPTVSHHPQQAHGDGAVRRACCANSATGSPSAGLSAATACWRRISMLRRPSARPASSSAGAGGRQALQRAQSFDGLEAPPRVLFQRALANRRPMRAIRTHARMSVERIRTVVWPVEPSLQWCWVPKLI
jgi:hypothetical protein